MFLEMMASLLILWLSGTSSSEQSVSPGPTQIDRIVAVVDDAIVTASEVLLEQQLLQFDAVSSPALAAPQPDLLRLLEDRRVLEQLAGTRSVYQPSAQELTQRRTQLLNNLGDRAATFMIQWGFTESSLDRFLSRRMTAERYVNRNLGRSLRTEVQLNTPEWEQLYRQRYRSWIEERRNQASIRRVGQTQQ